MTVFTASEISSKIQLDDLIESGWPKSRSFIWVITPRVPSDPTKSRVKSYPDADFGALDPVVISRPSGKATLNAKTFSRIVPYRTELVPDALVAHMPPIDASAPGSTVNISP